MNKYTGAENNTLNKSSFFKVLAFVSILATISIFLLAIFVFSPSFSSVFDFSQLSKTTITSVLANLAAPILTIVSSVLLYLALIKQTESKKFQVEKNELDMCFTLYNQLNTEYNNITIKKAGSRVISGIKERYLEIYQGHQALVESLPLISEVIKKTSQ